MVPGKEVVNTYKQKAIRYGWLSIFIAIVIIRIRLLRNSWRFLGLPAHYRVAFPKCVAY
jgi:hypothetical protein